MADQEGINYGTDLVALDSFLVEPPIQHIRQIHLGFEIGHDIVDRQKMAQGTVETIPRAQPYKLINSLCHDYPFAPCSKSLWPELALFYSPSITANSRKLSPPCGCA
jgi:hypothetical protein